MDGQTFWDDMKEKSSLKVEQFEVKARRGLRKDTVGDRFLKQRRR
jgi:hypothetical protein